MKTALLTLLLFTLPNLVQANTYTVKGTIIAQSCDLYTMQIDSFSQDATQWGTELNGRTFIYIASTNPYIVGESYVVDIDAWRGHCGVVYIREKFRRRIATLELRVRELEESTREIRKNLDAIEKDIDEIEQFQKDMIRQLDRILELIKQHESKSRHETGLRRRSDQTTTNNDRFTKGNWRRTRVLFLPLKP